MADPNYAKQIAHLERINAERLQEIKRLEKILYDEEQKTIDYSRQIDEMTDFLADYGLHWVGGDAPKSSAFPRGPTDMGLFEQKIRDLNAMAEQGVEFQKEKTGVTKVKQQKPIHIKLLDDGFKLDDGELRLYSLPISSDFFQDIMDGFFPLEFKSQYPEGVKLIVEDLRKIDLFKGNARKLVETAKRDKGDYDIPEKKEIGEGNGKIKIKFSNGKETLAKLDQSATVLILKQLIEKEFGITKFTLCSPPSLILDDDEKTLSSLGLFPRGLLILTIPK
ncbi:hypothetical protein TRFO_13149 [Tritrichomonas foetus]|uniref:SEP domain-containing protein n=1 Tax=Tritrichomonas foetus TaxID=1144522 RepID=A0A1J4KZH7_9EUKA|nr:hypothetical protein TRFO_13149 [Tritrichomonas foetus]|eukprot:OHT16554.1 hypothetical protein TRFO_13149 [Tritrichomonas foetus]